MRPRQSADSSEPATDEPTVSTVGYHLEDRSRDAGERVERRATSGVHGDATAVGMTDGEETPADVDGVARPGYAGDSPAVHAPVNGTDKLFAHCRRNAD